MQSQKFEEHPQNRTEQTLEVPLLKTVHRAHLLCVKFNDGDEPVAFWLCPHPTPNNQGLSTLSLHSLISQSAQIIKLLHISNCCASPVLAAAPSGEDPEENSSPSSWGQPRAHLDVLQEDAPTPLVLQLHQLLSVLPLLVGLVQEVLGKVFQGHIIPVKIVGLKNKNEFTGSKPASGWLQSKARPERQCGTTLP